jgi:hypothetical protein
VWTGKTRIYGVAGVLTLSLAWSPALAGQVYYSDSCNEQESGDVAGYVVIFSDGERLPEISFSWSEGALMLPARADVTDYDRRSGRLKFVVKTQSGEFSFTGMIRPHAIEGTLSNPFDSPRQVELEERSRTLAFEPRAECK